MSKQEILKRLQEIEAETLRKMVGKTITKAEIFKVKGYDDEYLKLTFSDDTSLVVEAGYDDYTGNSCDEYPTWLVVEWGALADENLELVNTSDDTQQEQTQNGTP